MSRKEIAGRFSTVRISEDLAGAIDEAVNSEDGRKLGFRSRADFVTKAVRDFVERDLTPVYLPGDLIKNVQELVKARKLWVSTQALIEEAVKDKLRQYEYYR